VIVRRLESVPDLAVGLARLDATLESLPTEGDELVRVEQPLAGTVDALDLPAGLPGSNLDPLMLLGPSWSGAGVTIQHDTPTPEALVAPPAGLRFALSCRFDPERDIDSEWQAFGRCRTWLPTLELDSERRLLALNWRPGLDRLALHQALTSWRPRATPSTVSVAVDWEIEPGTRSAWHQTVDAALDRITGTDTLPLLRKIVLARPQHGGLSAPVAAADLLRAAPLGTVGWPWWLQHGRQSWLGETPERLGVRDGTTLRSLALAGTRPRHHDPERDESLGRELLDSDKDRREQAAVADWLRGQLAHLASCEPEVGDLALHRLPSLQHLARTLSVTSREPLQDARWIAALHPTPALCGAPRTDVRSWLREMEPFDRGLYGGVLGWVESDRAVAQVAIRGLRLHHEQVTVYAGAGLVRGSDPAREWAETGAKVRAVCRRLGLQPPREVAG